MSYANELRSQIKERLHDEVGTLYKDSPQRIALTYPSPYHTGMSSLGFQSIYREINQNSPFTAERAFLPDNTAAHKAAKIPLCTYETGRAVRDFPVIGLSVAYELELAGVIETLELAGLPPLAEARDASHPFILAGGPLTFSNPLPLAPFVDAILMGEADETIHQALEIIFTKGSREEICRALADQIESCYVPSIHGDSLRPVGKASFASLPAYAAIRTPHTELRNMFLLEAERGCSRGCAYCVMRRSTNGGMRIVPKEVIFARIPEDAPRVGLVGAAVSDHPHIVDIVQTLADRGQQVGISSLRPDRLNDAFVGALKSAGYRTLTTASDGSSQRLRDQMQRKAQERHLIRAAELARAHQMKRLKLYMMVGLPEETFEDIDELIGFGVSLSKIIPLSLGIAPFVAKRNTPLDGSPFAGIPEVEKRLARLRQGVRGKVDLRATSARWAWVEYVLAQGGQAQGRAVLDAVHAGGRFAHYKAAFQAAEKPQRKLHVMPYATVDVALKRSAHSA